MTRQRILIAALVALIAVSPFLGIPAWTPALATVAWFMAISLIGLNLIFGITGMLALGHAAFTALPGFAAGIMQNLGTPAWLAIPAGVAMAVGVARLLAGIFTRLPGIYFAIGTLGFAFVVEGLTRAFPSLTGGASGLVLVLPVTPGPFAWYALAVASLLAATLVYMRLVRGKFLRTLKLIRHDELAAEVLGVDVSRMKSRIFTIGCTYAAVGGVLLAYFTGVLVPENGGVNNSLEYLAMVIIGGAGTAVGPLVGSAVVQWLFMLSGSVRSFEILAYGLAFFVIVVFAPAGLVGLLRRPWAALAARVDVGAGRTARSTSAPMPEVPSPATARWQGRCLDVKAACKRFGGVVAVDDVDIDVSHGEIVSLIGPNGAGKSTLFNLVSGIEPASSGSIRLRGEDIGAKAIHARAAAIGRSFQVPRLVPGMTVLENVMARLDHLPARLGEAQKRTLALRQLADFGLAGLAEKPVNEVSLGYHKLIDLARASIGEPPLLLLDEPAVGLTEAEVQHLMKMLLMLKRQGAAILVVEHNIDFVVNVTDRIFVMDSSRRIAAGTAADVMADPAVQEAYFGVLHSAPEHVSRSAATRRQATPGVR